MFTLKFYRFYTDGSSNSSVVATSHYSVYTRKEGTCEIVIYEKNTEVEGVAYQVGSNQALTDYDICYIENQSGKTIDCIKSPEKSLDKVVK